VKYRDIHITIVLSFMSNITNYSYPVDLTIKWHYPSPEEIEFAAELFESQVNTAVERLRNLISDNPSVRRQGMNKEWSDEVSRNLSQLRLIISGVANLFDPEKAAHQSSGTECSNGNTLNSENNAMEVDDDPLAELGEDDRPQVSDLSSY